MEHINPRIGPRAALYSHFRAFASPMFTLVSPVQVDAERWKTDGGLFPNILWAVLDATNSVPQLRQRFVSVDGEEWIGQHASVDCTCTVARADESFTFCTFAHDPDRARFVAGVPGQIEAASASEGLDLTDQHRHDLIYLSSVPWMDFTGVSHAMPGDPDDCIPRILWGRVVQGRLSVAATAHHAMVDGLHLARFFAALQERLG